MTMTKKKNIVFAIAGLVILIGAIVAVTIFNRPVIAVSSEKTEYGQTGYFAVSAKGFEDIIGSEFSIAFDSEVIKIMEITNGSLLSSVSVSEEDYANSNGRIEVMYLDYSGGDKPIKMDGDVLYVRYEVIKPLNCKLSLEDVKFVDSSMEYMDSFRVKDGKIKTNAVH